MKRLMTGTVISDSANKTIIVSVASRKMHALYKKRYTVNLKFMAHDEKNAAKKGDLVVIEESRPLSARKRFILKEIADKAAGGFVETDATADVPTEEPKQKPEAEKPAKSKAKPIPATDTEKTQETES